MFLICEGDCNHKYLNWQTSGHFYTHVQYNTNYNMYAKLLLYGTDNKYFWDITFEKKVGNAREWK